MPGKVFGRKCNEDHDRLVDRNCRRQVSDAAVTSVSVRLDAPVSDNPVCAASTSNTTPSDVNSLILQNSPGLMTN